MEYEELLGRIARIIANGRHDTILAFEIDMDSARNILAVVYDALREPSSEMMESAKLIPVTNSNHNIGTMLDESQIRALFSAVLVASPLNRVENRI